jgi:MORN repeat
MKLGIDNSWSEGDYVKGKKEGKGKYLWPDGSFYEGEWRENKINGYVDFLYIERAITFGLMVEFIKANRRIIIWMGKVSISGQMEECMRENI